MDRRAEITRHVTIFAICAPCALLVWVVFHAVFTDLSAASRAVGYVDSGTEMAIALGYVAMIGGTLVFAGIALWSGVRALSLWLAERRSSR
ncbi:MAG TPA: hypothetical protein VMF61_16300 [Candidatus Acidoferrales bacterium]|nr:hypothetical protein [Candidatus Acidoferrales bacterium]